MANKYPTTLHIKPETWERCKKYGLFGDSQDELINRILDLAGTPRHQEELVPEPHKTPDKGYEAPTPEIKQEVINEQPNSSSSQ